MSIKTDCKIDATGFHNMLRNMEKLIDHQVDIGYDDTKHEDSDLTMGELARIHEYGVRGGKTGWKIPPRNFVEDGANLLNAIIAREVRLVAVNTLQGRHPAAHKHLVDIGDKGEETLVQAIDDGKFWKLKPTTIKIKRDRGLPHPEAILVATGQLREGAVVKIK